MLSLDSFLDTLRSDPASIDFSDTIALIEVLYDFTPTSFRNGGLVNAPDQNQGACRILAFGQRHELTEQEVLHCFGHYYRDEVLSNPDGEDHQNIRHFIEHGWPGVVFDAMPLTPREGSLAGHGVTVRH